MTLLPKVKLKALVTFPTSILDGTGVDVVNNNGTYQFNLDFGDFAPPAASVTDTAQQNALLWNANTGAYTLVPMSVFATLPGAALPLMDSTATVGVSALYSREDHIHPTDTTRAPLASPTFTGDPKAPTPTVGDNDTSVATTAFVTGAITTAVATIAPVLRSYLAGLTLSAAGSSATFGIAAGVAADSTAAAMMLLASAYTKTTAAWAVGSTSGALDTGVIAASTWYHVYLIRRTDTGVVDICVSLSPTTPTFAGSLASYTQFRRIGSIKTDGSSVWTAFTQVGDEFIWSVPPTDVNIATLTTTAALQTLSVPSGVQVRSLVRGAVAHATAGTAVLLSSPDETSTTASGSNFTAIGQVTNQLTAWGVAIIRTNTSSQIRAISSAAATTTLRITTIGWLDNRGRDA